MRRFAWLGRTLVIDITPLRASGDFRRLFNGSVLGFLARQITVVAIPFHVYDLTGSTLMVGALGIVQFAPLMVASLVGGAVIDAIDRRKLLIWVQILLAATAAGMMLNAAAPNPAVWPLFALSALEAGLQAIDNPTRMAVLPGLLRRGLVPSGLALHQGMTQLASAGGPLIGGFLIARTSMEATYLAVGVVSLASAVAMLRIRPLRPLGGGRRAGLASIVEGLRYVARQRLIRACFVIDINAMVFAMPRALFPALGTVVFGGGAEAVGLLYSAPGIGALVAALTSGWVGSVRRRGRVVVVAVMLWGAGIALLGVVSSLPLALVVLAFAGAADAISAVFRNTLLQLTAPDAMRGRLASVHGAVVDGGPRMGDLVAGSVASFTSARIAVTSGGLACILGALAVARRFRELWDYDGESVEDAPSG
jgi:MFS family permease